MTLQFLVADDSDISVIFSQAKTLIDTYEDIASIDYEKVLAWVKRKIEAHICTYCCVMADGEKCAYYRLCDDGELDDLYVLPPFRNKGIGTQILQKCMDEAENQLYLYVFQRNLRAISFYERFGFTIREKIGKTRFIMIRSG